MEHSGRDAATLGRSLHHVFRICRILDYADIYADLNLMVLVQLKCLTPHALTLRALNLASPSSRFSNIGIGLQ